MSPSSTHTQCAAVTGTSANVAPTAMAAGADVANSGFPDCVVTRVPCGTGTSKPSGEASENRTMHRAGCAGMRYTPMSAPR